MNRITKKDLESAITRLTRRGLNVGLDCAYGGFRITDSTGSTDLSWRGTARECLIFLAGMETALDQKEGWLIAK